MGEERSVQAQVNERIAAKIPAKAWESIVPIVVANPPSIHLLGTGSLFEIAGDFFVVTAAHVIKLAYEKGKTLGISDDGTSFIALGGEWFVSAPVQRDGVEDPFDVAVYRLPGRAVERLRAKRFLRRADIEFDEHSPTAVFAVFGFPGLWSMGGGGDGETLRLKALEYVTYASSATGRTLIGFDSKYHFLLDGTAKQVALPDGSPMVFRHRDGAAATFPRDLRGISGCAVWVLGDLAVPVDEWRPAQVVAVQTGVYQDSEVIRATRWVAVTTLLNEACPELRPAMLLWTPQ